MGRSPNATRQESRREYDIGGCADWPETAQVGRGLWTQAPKRTQRRSIVDEREQHDRSRTRFVRVLLRCQIYLFLLNSKIFSSVQITKTVALYVLTKMIMIHVNIF